MAKKTAFKIEISRTFTFVDWATFIVYADTPEEAHKLAQAEAARANEDDSTVASVALRDDGEASEWTGHEPELPDARDLRTYEVLGEEPDDEGEEA